MKRLSRLQSGFTLVELIVVVALMALLGTGAVMGLKRSRDNAAFRKSAQNLNAIDLAKQTWQRFHPDDIWPATEAERWAAVAEGLKLSGSAIESPAGSGFFFLPGFAPEGHAYRVGDLEDPAAGQCDGRTIHRPLD